MKSMNTAAIFVLMCTATITVWGQQTKHPKSGIPKFEGTWILNREKSSGLTGALGNAEIRLIVNQNSKQLTAEQKVVIRNREQPSQELVYKLDGSENETEVVRPLAGTMKLKARWLEASKVLELHSAITGETEGKPATITTLEQWQLIGDTLRIIRTRRSPQGTLTFKLVFEKP
ncbi:MAG: hypothetical protein JST85_22225 [Acidobacteria bacterium]|nr:hypothetical protein [Acidobacteriota bacterium]